MRDKVDRMLAKAAASAMLISAATSAKMAVDFLDKVDQTMAESIESLADELAEMAGSIADDCEDDLNVFGPPPDDDDFADDDFTSSEYEDFGDCHFGDDDDDE